MGQLKSSQHIKVKWNYATTDYLGCTLVSYSNIDGRVDTERSIFGWERPPGSFHDHLVPSADVSIGDELVAEATIQPSVIWLADAQEIWRQIASHDLAGVDKDVGGEQAKREDTCGKK